MRTRRVLFFLSPFPAPGELEGNPRRFFFNWDEVRAGQRYTDANFCPLFFLFKIQPSPLCSANSSRTIFSWPEERRWSFCWICFSILNNRGPFFRPDDIEKAFFFFFPSFISIALHALSLFSGFAPSLAGRDGEVAAFKGSRGNVRGFPLLSPRTPGMTWRILFFFFFFSISCLTLFLADGGADPFLRETVAKEGPSLLLPRPPTRP